MFIKQVPDRLDALESTCLAVTELLDGKLHWLPLVSHFVHLWLQLAFFGCDFTDLANLVNDLHDAHPFQVG